VLIGVSAAAHRATPHAGPDTGSILPLVIGYVAIAAVLITVGIDVSKVFLAQRALDSSADAAALAAAQGVDTAAVYDGTIACGKPLPLDLVKASDLVGQSFTGDQASLRRTFRSLGAPRTSVADGTATVGLSGDVAVPFGQVLSWLDPGHPHGLVRVSDTAHARSPVAGIACDRR
jgi:Putative Flp pilus-assembly TadE/G-like